VRALPIGHAKLENYKRLADLPSSERSGFCQFLSDSEFLTEFLVHVHRVCQAPQLGFRNRLPRLKPMNMTYQSCPSGT
jgi:hypothetical protein